MGTMLVTGGAGFIGSNFVRQVLADGKERVLVLDKLTYAGSLENLAGLTERDGFSFIEGDIADRSCLEELFAKQQPAAVVNFAAETHVDRSIDSPKPFVDTNIVGAFELLEACRRHVAGLDAGAAAAFRFLHVSTDEVYGSLGAEGLFSESSAYAPNSPYAASKAAADHLVRAYHRTYALPALITNCSNNYGPYQFPEKLIPLMILNAVEGGSLPIYGDGGNVRDWIYVEDHCEGILAVLRGGRPGESYNIGGEGEKTNIEVVDTICEILEELLPAADNRQLVSNRVQRYADLKNFVPDRKGHDRRYAIDASKVRTELGWLPKHDFQRGMRATVRWYLDHRDWCETIQQRGRYRRERLGMTDDKEKRR
jgi:dTDP-glucose 4,6-dehydratase